MINRKLRIIKLNELHFFLILQTLNETFPNHTFLLNGLIQGVKVSAMLYEKINNLMWNVFKC
jgi:hypothetical protein